MSKTDQKPVVKSTPKCMSQKSKRRAIQNALFEQAMDAKTGGDNESLVKLATVFERMFQNDQKVKSGSSPAGNRSKVAANDLEAKRDQLRKQLAGQRGGQK